MPKDKDRVMIGDISVDDRGRVSYCNDFDFEDVKRFYMVQNHRAGFVRAWHAHEREAKYVTVIKGAAIIGVVKVVGNFAAPSKGVRPDTLVLSGDKPTVIYIPAGYANGARTLTADTILMYYSTKSLGEDPGDDYRYPARYWDCWKVEER